MRCDHYDIAHMKQTAYLINTARGDNLDRVALINAHVDGRIVRAGLDVFVDEPEIPVELCTMENGTLLPHIDSATQEVRLPWVWYGRDNL